MGDLHLVQAHTHDRHDVAEERMRRLVEHRDRLAALLRARPRGAVGAVAEYRSSYAARLWALAEASEAEAR